MPKPTEARARTEVTARADLSAPSHSSVSARELLRGPFEALANHLSVDPLSADFRNVVRDLDAYLQLLTRGAGLTGESEILVRFAALQAAYPAVSALIQGRVSRAENALVEVWSYAASRLVDPFMRTEPTAWELSERGRPGLLPGEQLTLLSRYQAAVLEYFREVVGRARGTAALESLVATLELDDEQLASMMGVEPAVTRAWRAGTEPLPAEKVVQFEEIERALKLLTEILVPERLPQIIRRPAKLFDGQTALDWILAGRIREVARRYDHLLQYQP